VWKYLFIWQLDQSPVTETGGLFFPKAIQHVFVGMYVQQLCLTVLFFLAQAIPMGVLMIVLISLTVRETIGSLHSFGTINSYCFKGLLQPAYCTLLRSAQVRPSAEFGRRGRKSE
jgi:hypothetical protein